MSISSSNAGSFSVHNFLLRLATRFLVAGLELGEVMAMLVTSSVAFSMASWSSLGITTSIDSSSASLFLFFASSTGGVTINAMDDSAVVVEGTSTPIGLADTLVRLLFATRFGLLVGSDAMGRVSSLGMDSFAMSVEECCSVVVAGGMVLDFGEEIVFCCNAGDRLRRLLAIRFGF